MLRKARIVTGAAGMPVASRRRPARVVPREADEARRAAAALLQGARDDARKIAEEAQADAERLRGAARSEGFAAGQAAALAQAVRFTQAEARADERHLQRTCSFARALAERLLGEPVAQQQDTVLLLARQVLAETRGATRARLECHPAAATRLAAALKSTGELALTVEPNAALSPLDLRLETEVGSLDARLGARLDLLELALREALAGDLQ